MTADTPRPARGGREVAAAGLAGFACMAAELTAVRLLAPHFGDSAYVWTNVIGVILAALAAGAWLGGRWATAAQPVGSAALALLLAGVWFAVVPFVAGPLGAWLLPAQLPLEAAMAGLVRGSFVATALLFAPPMLCLGAISPLLVTGLARAGVLVGNAVGRVSAAGTIGSLLGTFLATHWLVPGFGCRVAMVSAGALLAAAAALLRRGRPRATGAGLAGLLLATALLHGGPLRPPPPGVELLAERESRCQFLQVLRERVGDEPARTRLAINEALDSFHSLAIEGSVFTGGAYYDWHAVAPLLAGDGTPPAALHSLSIGDAAGTVRRIYAAAFPDAVVDHVDIDAATMQLGDAHFPGPKAAGARFELDGRVFLEHADARWHTIHVDAYAHQVYVPAHLASREFFRAAKQRLLPGGVIVCNIGALEPDDPVLLAVGTTMAAEFGAAMAFLIPYSRNALLVARRDLNISPATLAAYAPDGAGLSASDAAQWRQVLAAAALPSAWFEVKGGIELLDDRPVLDRLFEQSYVSQEDPGQTVPCAGSMASDGAEVEAYARRQAKDWGGVLAAVAQSQRATAFLRQVAGDARWEQRQLHSAIAEYEAGLLLQPEPRLEQALRDKLRQVQELVVPIDLAATTAARNSWLQAAAITMFVLLVGLLRRQL